MQSIIDYTKQIINSDNFNLFVGGHYTFPNNPSPFAKNSISVSKKLKEYSDKKSILYSFINDIRINNFCSFNVCEVPNLSNQNTIKKQIKSASDLFSIQSQDIELYDNDFSIKLSTDLENYLKSVYFSENHFDFVAVATKLNDFFKTDIEISHNNDNHKISNIFQLYQASEQYLIQPKGIDKFSYALDTFFYNSFKNNFHPFQFTKDKIISEVLFEKAVYNFASKLIRKLHKKNVLPALIVDLFESDFHFKCKNYSGNEVLLRKETASDEYFNATNKCPLIIATLYYKLISENSNKKKLNIIYQIPSYDRNKVNLGAECFFNLFYPYLIESNIIKEVNIYNIYWLSDNSEYFVCDKFIQNQKETTFCENNILL